MGLKGEMGPEDFNQIKNMVKLLKLDDVAVDLSRFIELIEKHHPNGMTLLEDIQKIDSDEDNPSYRYRLPAAIVEFQQILKKKYKDDKMESAVFMRVIEELIIQWPSLN